MQVNGEIVKLEEKLSLQSYLEANNYDVTRIAVEKNGEIVSKGMYAECILSDNDTLEIVHFVGGG